MTLAPATSVGFAVVGGAPADARQWITVDLEGFPGSGRRGYIVATEPIEHSWSGLELATQAREIIVTELRRLHHLPPDEALGRSLAAANGVVAARSQEIALTGVDSAPMIGVTAIIFENQFATLAYLPPGQLILVEDGLIYTVPDFESWFPGYQVTDSAVSQAEPLGFASWTAPLMAQTEVRAGDTIVLCSAETGRAFVEDMVDSGRSVNDLSHLHHRDPDAVLDAFKDVVIARELSTASVAVIGFPPLPNSAQIQSLGDVGRRARDSWRHGKASLRQLKPAPKSVTKPVERRLNKATATPEQVSAPATPVATIAAAPVPPAVPRAKRAEERFRRIFEAAPDKKAGWKSPTMTAEFGVPGAHGVDVFRGQSHYMGDPSWRHNLPRLPIIGSAWIWPLMLMIIAGVVIGGLWARQEFFMTKVDTDSTIEEIDRRIVAARDADSDEEVAAELAVAQESIDLARDSGVPDETLDQRQQVVTELMDDATDVIRMSDVQRIGTLPEEFGGAPVQGVYTPAGVFFVAGSLYQYRPSADGATPELITILSEGETIGDATVGKLWGLAFDVKGLYVTDGETVFMLPVESQEWRAVRLGKINNQPWIPGPVAAFDGALYLLEAEYRQIYRFQIDGTEGEAEPRDWLFTGARDQIEIATDLAIDRSIFVLINDGTIQEMYQGDLDSTVEPSYIDPDKALALVGSDASGYLYVAVEAEDAEDGRIIAFDANGKQAVQLKLPIGFNTGDANVREPFDGVQEVVVDERSGTIYIINSDGIWTARFSLPQLPQEEPPPDLNATPVA